MSLIKFISSRGAAAGLLQVPDLLNLPDQRAAVLAEAEGTYGDVYIGSAASANFICRVQHRVDASAAPFAAVISPFYASRLGAYDSSVVDLTSAAELEVVSGSLATYNAGITTAGDYEFLYPFLGTANIQAPSLAIQLLVADAVGTPSNLSFFGCGLIDTANKGTKRVMVGPGYYLAGLAWKSARITDAAVALGASLGLNIWLPPAMPAGQSRVTPRIGFDWSSARGAASFSGTTVAHTDLAAATSGAALTTVTMTAAYEYGSAALTSASTTLDIIQEVISPIGLDIPAAGY